MKNKLKTVVLSLLLALPFMAKSQPEPSASPSFDSKIFTGGSLGLQFGTFTLIEISPIVGYKVTERFTPGISVTYMYEKYQDPSGVFPTYSTSIYGGSVFLRYYVIPEAFAQVEYQVLNLDVPSTTGYTLEGYRRANITQVFIGGGYRQPIGARSSFNILLLYDINQDPFSPYQNPVIQVGFGIGI